MLVPPTVGDVVEIPRSRVTKKKFGLLGVGKTNPDPVVVTENSPTVTGIDSPPTTIVELTPVNVNVRVFPPEPKTTELVPDPVQSVQLKVPVVENEVVNPSSPFGRITNGSAWADIDVNRKNRTSSSNLRIEVSSSPGLRC